MPPRGTKTEKQGRSAYNWSDPPDLEHYIPKLMVGGTELAYGTSPTRDGRYTFDGTRCRGEVMIRLGAGASFNGGTGNWSVSLPMPINLTAGNNLAIICGHGTVGIAPSWPVGHEYGAFHTAHFGVRLHGGRYEDLTDVNAAYLIANEAVALGGGLQHNAMNPFLLQASSAAGYYTPKTALVVADWKDFHLLFDYPVLGTH